MKRVPLTRFEARQVLEAVNAALAGPTDWQDCEVDMLGGDGNPVADAWLERSTAALVLAAGKLAAVLKEDA